MNDLWDMNATITTSIPLKKYKQSLLPKDISISYLYFMKPSTLEQDGMEIKS